MGWYQRRVHGLQQLNMKNPIIAIWGTSAVISVLDYAAAFGKLEIFKNVSSTLTNINPKASSGQEKGKTPLHWAGQNGKLEIVKYIVSCITDINPSQDNGKTVMRVAAEKGALSVVRWYLDNLEGDKNPPNKIDSDVSNGRTPLHAAAQWGHLEVVKAISKVIVDKNPGDGHKYTPFHLASQNSHLPVVKYLINFVPDVDIRLDEYWDNTTPLHRTSQFGNLATVKYLIEKGADPKLKTKSGKTAYDYAVSKEKSDIADYLKQFN